MKRNPTNASIQLIRRKALRFSALRVLCNNRPRYASRRVVSNTLGCMDRTAHEASKDMSLLRHEGEYL